ncbi:hypothetical protein ACGFYM_33510 [Streptomyces sp. NPDC048231]|uniref:hypothetical protein n=1 Tax=Streptomyces sp. NPDC048231 TaxID=3365519 RepID=UPI00372266F9
MIRRWSVPLGANMLVGIPGVIPYWLLWYLASSWATGPAPEENDGMALWLVIVVPIVGLYALLWASVNRPLARRSALTPHAYWSLSILATFLPTAALIIYSP